MVKLIGSMELLTVSSKYLVGFGDRIYLIGLTNKYLLLFFAGFWGMSTDVGKIGNYFLGVFSFTGTRFTTDFGFVGVNYIMVGLGQVVLVFRVKI